MISKSLLTARPRLAAADEDEPKAITLTVNETEPNSTPEQAQIVNRANFTVDSNPNLARPDLPSITVAGTISSPSDKDFYRLELSAGELVVIDVDSVTGGLDAFVTLYSAAGFAFLIDNDDPGFLDAGTSPHPTYGHNTDSFIQFRAPFTGSYYVVVESFQDQSNPTSGSYKLNLSIGPVATAAQIHEENVGSLISGDAWPTTALTYGFPTSPTAYGTDGQDEIAGGFAPLNNTQIATVQKQLAYISNLTNLEFSQLTANPGSAQLRYALSNEPETAHAYYPGPGNGGDSWYNQSSYTNPIVGNYAYMTFLHETGHALGLEHGHESPFALSYYRDSLEYSVMTYRPYVAASVDDTGGYKNETFGYPQTFMMYDIAALQRMYGADFSFNSGDTVYSWNDQTGALSLNGTVAHTPGANRVFMTVWDGGGSDTYDLSNYSDGVTISLRPGEWTTTSAVQLAGLGLGRVAIGNIANSLLYQGNVASLIENAVGGAGNDLIYGNQVANRLDGGLGNDLLVGDLGDDLLLMDDGGHDQALGGEGDDVLFYGGALTVADSNDGGAGNDTVVLQGNYNLALGTGSLIAMGGISLQSGSVTRWGQNGNNSYDYVLATVNANVGAGQQFRVNAQSLLSGEDFTFDGSAETDGGFLVYAGFGIDQLTGSNSAYGDVFFFEAGRFGQGDKINGGTGDDAVVISGVAAGQSLLSTTIVSGTFQSIEALSFNGRYASDPNARPSYDVVLQDGNIAAGGQLIVNGSSLAVSQGLAFNASSVTTGSLLLFGGAGGGHLRGGANADLIYAGGGGDLLFGGAGADIFQYRALSDALADNRDLIQDFLRGTDKIDLSRLDADLDAAGDQAFTFIGENAFSGANGELRAYATGNGSWFVEADVNGNGSPDFRIEIFTTDNLALASNDFVL